MTKVEKKYAEFKKQEDKTWLDKMVWTKGQNIFNSGSIDRFIRETNPFTDDTVVNTVDDYFKFIDKLSNKYESWVKEKDSSFKNSDFADMKNFFKG
jgi:ABC-type bacteriocin/lantibiotic exporter with double-glycine peptidase domain